MAGEYTTGRIRLYKPDNGEVSGDKDSGVIWTTAVNEALDKLSNVYEYMVVAKGGICTHNGRVITVIR